MYAIAIFLLKSVIISGLLLGGYWLALRNKKLHVYNRFYLLSIVPLSLLIPMMHFDWYRVNAQHTSKAFTVLQAISSGKEETYIANAQQHISVAQISGVLYTLIGFCLLALFIARLRWIYGVKKKYACEKQDRVTIVYTDITNAPFSFFNNLFWRNTIDMDSVEGRKIIAHELVHIKQHHTLDKIYMQLVLTVCWINPVYWFVQKELALVHEFIADEKAIDDGDTASFASMLLCSQYNMLMPDIIHPFFYSPIKRRILMLTTSNKTNYSILRRLLVLPLLATALLLFSFSVNKETTVTRADKPITMVLDAGHGGKDKGTTGTNGVDEKDLNLRIAKKISELAGQYNIQVILTRKGDDYPTLEERAKMAMTHKADIFLSIHINGEDGVLNGNGYEIIVDRKSPQYANSNVLASAISAEMQGLKIQPRFVEKGLYVLKNVNMPAVLIECGYINNAKEMEMLKDTKLEMLCRSILMGVVDYENSKK